MMTLQYTLTQQDYIAYLTLLLKKRDHTAERMLLLALSTVVQFGACVVLCLIMNFTRQQQIGLYVMSALVAAMSVFRWAYRKGRAKSQLERNKSVGRVTEDTWKPHTLSISQKKAVVTYGKVRLTRDLKDFDKVESLGGQVLLWFGGSVLEIVPAALFAQAQQEELEQLAQARKEQVRQELETFRHEVPAEMAEKLPQNIIFEAAYEYGLSEYCRNQVKAQRSKYLLRAFWTGKEWTRIGMTVLALVWMATKLTPLRAAITAGLVLVLNLPHVLCFSPLMAVSAKKDAEPLYEGEQSKYVRLYVAQEQMAMLWGKNLFIFPAQDIRHFRQDSDMFVIYLNKGTILTIPCRAMTGEQSKVLVRYLEKRSEH